MGLCLSAAARYCFSSMFEAWAPFAIPAPAAHADNLYLQGVDVPVSRPAVNSATDVQMLVECLVGALSCP